MAYLSIGLPELKAETIYYKHGPSCYFSFFEQTSDLYVCLKTTNAFASWLGNRTGIFPTGCQGHQLRFVVYWYLLRV
jgi:hypothetical protein